MQCYQMLLLLVGNLEPHPVPAVTEHPSDVPDGLRPLGLGVVPSIDGLAYQLHLALSLRNRHRGFPQRPRPGPDCPTKRKKKKKKSQNVGAGFSARHGVKRVSTLDALFGKRNNDNGCGAKFDKPWEINSREGRRTWLVAASFASLKCMVLFTPPSSTCSSTRPSQGGATLHASLQYMELPTPL